MGSYALLRVGLVQLDEYKGYPTIDYSVLFQRGDLCSKEFVSDENEVYEWPLARRALRESLDRLELLGYTMTRIEEHVRELLVVCADDFHNMYAGGEPQESGLPGGARPDSCVV